MEDAAPPLPPALAGRARWGARAGVAFHILVIVAFTGVCAGQIIYRTLVYEPAPAADCAAGLAALEGGLTAALAATRTATEERAAIRRFREVLGPAWVEPAAIGRACQADPARSARYHALYRLRFAEESALRRGTAGMNLLRSHLAEGAGSGAAR